MIEEMICKDKELSSLDRKLAGVYAEASKIATSEYPPVLKAEQRGWIKGRNDCWKSNAPRECAESAYRLRIAKLQARYRLVPANGPFWYFCNDDPRDEVVVTFFQTNPPTLIAERSDQVSLMYLQKSGSESPSASRITVLRDGLMDDSVRSERWDIALQRTAESIWSIKEVRRSWRCWRGDKTNGFASTLCP